MAATDASRKAFALSAMSIFTQYGFTGIDVDWEFPQSYKDSAGKIIPGSDGDNLGKLLTTLRYYFDMNTKIHYTISLAVPTIPTIYNYPLAEMAKYADFVNVMTYDLNGPWDATALPNTDNRQIKATFDSLVTHAKFPKNKLLLGLAFYGRSYKLTDPASCNGIGCSFVKGGNAYAGACSQTSGYVFMSDILSLRAGGAIARSDATTGTSWLITSDGSWVTFDSYADFKRKDAYAKSICLGGTFVWEIDQDPQSKYTYW
ncbi:glycoside hydrolase [Obelidium mucronatum]|nr:glycoside hydrolase [Obelidium mucronatum]